MHCPVLVIRSAGNSSAPHERQYAGTLRFTLRSTGPPHSRSSVGLPLRCRRFDYAATFARPQLRCLFVGLHAVQAPAYVAAVNGHVGSSVMGEGRATRNASRNVSSLARLPAAKLPPNASRIPAGQPLNST